MQLNNVALISSVVQIMTIVLGLCISDDVNKNKDWFKTLGTIVILVLNTLFYLYLGYLIMPTYILKIRVLAIK